MVCGIWWYGRNAYETQTIWDEICHGFFRIFLWYMMVVSKGFCAQSPSVGGASSHEPIFQSVVEGFGYRNPIFLGDLQHIMIIPWLSQPLFWDPFEESLNKNHAKYPCLKVTFPRKNPEELIFSRCGCHLAGQLEVTGELPVWTKSKAWLRYDMKISISIYRWWDIIEFTINFCSHWSFDFSAWNHWRGWLGQTQWTDLEVEQRWNWSLWDFMGIQRSNMGRPLNSWNTGIDHAEDLTILPLGEPWKRTQIK